MKKAIENSIIVLTADDGMKLTNGDAFGTTVHLGVNDSADNWHEVTEAEAEKMMEEIEKEELTAEEALSIIMGGNV